MRPRLCRCSPSCCPWREWRSRRSRHLRVRQPRPVGGSSTRARTASPLCRPPDAALAREERRNNPLGQRGKPRCRRAPDEVGQGGNVLRELVPEMLDPLRRRSLGQERVHPREDADVPRLEPLQQAVEQFLNAVDELGEFLVGRPGRIQGRPVRPPRQAARISLTRQPQPELGRRLISRTPSSSRTARIVA
jgi:hypothetical protein